METVARITPEAPAPLVDSEAVDRLEERCATPCREHPKELAEGPLFVGNVDQNRAGRDDVDARVVDVHKLVRGRLDKAAPLRRAELLRQLTAHVEQVLRDVREDHVPGATR